MAENMVFYDVILFRLERFVRLERTRISLSLRVSYRTPETDSMSRRLAVLCLLSFTVACGHTNFGLRVNLGPTPESNCPPQYPPSGSGPNHVDHVVSDGNGNFHWVRTELNAGPPPKKK